MCRVSELNKREEATLLWVARNAMVHDEKRLWTSADWLANTGRGVIKAQVSSRSSSTAGRSAAEGDETIAATHAKI
jgi:hypothetical protein